MTATAKTAVRYYVARETGDVTVGFQVVIMARLASLAAAKQHQQAVFEAGINAPLVVTAPDVATARSKAERCYARTMSLADARNPRIH